VRRADRHARIMRGRGNGICYSTNQYQYHYTAHSRSATMLNEYVSHSLDLIMSSFLANSSNPYILRKFLTRGRETMRNCSWSTDCLRCVCGNSSNSHHVGARHVLSDVLNKGALPTPRIEIGTSYMCQQTYIINKYCIVNYLNICLIAHMMNLIGIFYNRS